MIIAPIKLIFSKGTNIWLKGSQNVLPVFSLWMVSKEGLARLEESVTWVIPWKRVYKWMQAGVRMSIPSRTRFKAGNDDKDYPHRRNMRQHAQEFYRVFSTLGGQHLPDCHEKLTEKSEKYSVNFTGWGGVSMVALRHIWGRLSMMREYYLSSKKFKTSSSIHLALDAFNSVNMSFNGSVTPR